MKSHLETAAGDRRAKCLWFLSCRHGGLALGCVALAALTIDGAAETNRTSIPFAQLGAAAGRQYTGNGLHITQSTEGASLHCVFQRIEGRVTREGLWLTSTAEPAKGLPFRVVAQSVGREHGIVTPLASTGEVQTDLQTTRFRRDGLDEEYTVSVDGVRQDFIVRSRPPGSEALRLEMKVEGARAEVAAEGARLLLDGSGRKLAYNHLHVTDAQGRELTARMEVVSPGQVAVVVEDAAAVYPVRIDPTFSDANWVSSFGVPGVLGAGAIISATVIDANGNVYVGGGFTNAGGVAANYIAKWNGSAWSALGSGMDGYVSALVCDTKGDLYAGGGFTTAGGVPANFIARWNGSAWSALDLGMDNAVNALACDTNGNLYAGGWFSTAGGVPANRVAKWNGTIWSGLGSGISSSSNVTLVIVYALACDKFGNLYAGGSFTSAGSTQATNVAKWNGGTWSALDPGVSNTVVYCLACDTNGNLYAGWDGGQYGNFSSCRVAKWNGSAWSDLGFGVSGTVRSLAFDRSGNLYAGGANFYLAGENVNAIAKWNGSAWSALGSDLGNGNDIAVVWALACDSSGNLYAGGWFSSAGSVQAANIAEWNGSAWSALGLGMDGEVLCLTCDRSGDLFAGGTFTAAGGVPARHIARWNGSAWSALGSGMDDDVEALACDTSGGLYVGGVFTTAGGVTANYIAKWSGSAWSALGSGISGSGMSGWSPFVSSLAFDSSGNLYAGGNFTNAGGVSANCIAKWDGIGWSTLRSGISGGSEFFPSVWSLACDSSDNLYAGGSFSSAGGVNATNIAKWNGSAWSALGSGMDPYGFVYSLACDSAGNLYAGGAFTTAGGVDAEYAAKWNGSAWSGLRSGMSGGSSPYPWVGSLVCDRSDNLYAGGFFTSAGGINATNIAKWDGSAWSALGSGMNGSVSSLAFDSSGNLYVGGSFTTAGTNASAFIAKALLSKSSYNLSLAKRGAGTNVITGLGTPGYTYALDLATNLNPPVKWLPIATNTPTSVNLVFTNFSPSPRAFYRTRYLP